MKKTTPERKFRKKEQTPFNNRNTGDNYRPSRNCDPDHDVTDNQEAAANAAASAQVYSGDQLAADRTIPPADTTYHITMVQIQAQDLAERWHTNLHNNTIVLPELPPVQAPQMNWTEYEIRQAVYDRRRVEHSKTLRIDDRVQERTIGF